MKSKLISVVIATAGIAIATSRADQTPPQLRNGRHVPSPNGKLIVFYSAPKVEIRDAGTSAILGTAEATPVHALRWTADSKTLIIVEHIAHGSDAFVVHFDGKRWKSIIPGLRWAKDYRAIAVVSVAPRKDSVELSYKTYGDTYLVSFTLTPPSKKPSHFQRRKISLQQWQQLKEFPLR